MINRVAKGRRLELKAKKELESEGYRIAFRSIRTVYNRVDFDNAWDIVCYNSRHWRFVQVKTGYMPSKERVRLTDIKYPGYVDKEIWCWRNRRWYKDYAN